MIILYVALAAFVFWVIGKVADNMGSYHIDGFPWYIMSITATMVAVIMLVTVPIGRADHGAQVHAMKALEIQLAESRDFDPLERATIQNKVATYNTWLAKAKYYRTTMWKLWYPSEVDTAGYINQREELNIG